MFVSSSGQWDTNRARAERRPFAVRGVARTLVRFEFLAVASAAYLKAHGTPTSLRDLRRHRCLMGFARGELPETHSKAGGRRIPVEGTFFSNSPAMLARAAAGG